VGHLHGGTASGVRSQNREIKYKNPLSSLRRKAPWPRSRTVRRLAMRASGRLKTFGLVFALPFVERPPLEEGGGTINPWRLWAALPHGVSRRDFFSWRWRFDYFPTSNNFKRSRIRCPSEPQAFSNACAKLVSGWVFPRQNLAYLFSAGGGPSKVPSSRTGTVGLPHTNGRRIRRNFFWTARRARSKGYWRGLRRPINRRAAGGRSGTPGDASMAASRPMGGYGKV
jgi:hypothetical protein